MSRSSHLSISPRRVPCQERGERRVAELLAAATSVIGDVGYDAATMSAIADRAGASIGSLYQFFPNKNAVARALCDSCGRKAMDLWTCLETRAASLSLKELVRQYVEQVVSFVDGNPAFFSLTDLPASACNPGMRERLRKQLARVLAAHAPQVSDIDAMRIADIILQINKGLMSRYAQASGKEREWVAEEFRALLVGYLKARLPSRKLSGAHV